MKRSSVNIRGRDFACFIVFLIMFRQEAHTSLGDNVERISVVKTLWLVLEGK